MESSFFLLGDIDLTRQIQRNFSHSTLLPQGSGSKDLCWLTALVGGGMRGQQKWGNGTEIPSHFFAYFDAWSGWKSSTKRKRYLISRNKICAQTRFEARWWLISTFSCGWPQVWNNLTHEARSLGQIRFSSIFRRHQINAWEAMQADLSPKPSHNQTEKSFMTWIPKGFLWDWPHSKAAWKQTRPAHWIGAQLKGVKLDFGLR